MIYCCEEHVDMALDTVVMEHETYPILNKVAEEKQLSTACEYCQNHAIYVVGN
jgi:CxxH/CxxC protein (TIGR04129 family)